MKRHGGKSRNPKIQGPSHSHSQRSHVNAARSLTDRAMFLQADCSRVRKGFIRSFLRRNSAARGMYFGIMVAGHHHHELSRITKLPCCSISVEDERYLGDISDGGDEQTLTLKGLALLAVAQNGGIFLAWRNLLSAHLCGNISRNMTYT